MRLTLCTALTLALGSPAFAEPLAGFRDLTIPAPHHGRDLVAGVWYPTNATGTPEMIGENPVFTGHPAQRDAPLAAQTAPVIVLSHGLGGHFLSLAWLGAGLAKSGAIVVGVNHPHSSARDFDMQKGLAHWTRAQDVSATLDWLTTAPGWTGAIDPARISALGFSYGGWTALSLGGCKAILRAISTSATRWARPPAIVRISRAWGAILGKSPLQTGMPATAIRAFLRLWPLIPG